MCYADILGWSDRIFKAGKDENKEELIRSAGNILHDAYDWIRRMTSNDVTYHVSIFSDSLIVSKGMNSPHKNAGEPEFGRMLTIFQMHQALLSSKGFPVRGALSAGWHYRDDYMELGDALVEAVRMEESGGPPRIVLGPSVMELLRRQLRFYNRGIGNTPHYKDLLKDNDGLAVERGLTETLSLPRVHEKYRWMAGYHNFVCKRFVNSPQLLVGEDMDLDQTIDIYEAATSKVSTFLIDNIGFPEPQVLPQSLQDQE